MVESKTFELVAPLIFLGVVFALILALVFVYKAVVNQSCTCLSDPGGREKARKERKNKEGYDQISPDDLDSSGDEMFVPPTMVVVPPEDRESDGKLKGELVGPKTLSPYSARSGYGDTFSLSQSYMSDRGLGRLRFDVDYAPGESKLKIRIIEGDDLPSKEKGGAKNFRIHLTLLPKKEQRFKSKTQSRYSPNFNETFEFANVAKGELFSTAVRFRLYGGVGKLVGETFFQLADIAKLDNPVLQGTWRAFRKIRNRENMKGMKN